MSFDDYVVHPELENCGRSKGTRWMPRHREMSDNGYAFYDFLAS